MSWLSSFLLHPALFWLLPLAAVPLVLHLLTLHRLKTVELSTFRFLFDSYVQQRRRMQFLEALLAMLRTLFILLLVLAFCRPVVKHWGGLFRSGSGREVVMLVDCSASMSVATAGVPAIDRAKTTAQSIVERLNPDDRLTLVRVVARPEEVFSRFSSDTESIRGKIEELKTSPARANLFAALMQVFGPEAPARKNPIVYVFTDCQSSGWREVRNQGVERFLPAGAEFIVVNVGSNEPVPNLAVVGEPPRRHRAVAGLPVLLHPRVVNHSKEEADATVTVFIDEKEVSRVPLAKLKPGEARTLKVIYTPTEPGTHRGRFEIAGKARDRFPEDDNFLFTLSVVPRVKVLLVNGNPAAADPFDSETLYLRTALNTDPEDKDKKPGDPKRLAAEKEFVRSLETQEIAEASLNPETLRDVSVVILANCGNLIPQQLTWLQEFVAAGGGLIVFPGDRVVTPDLYNNQLFTIAGPPRQELTPAKLGPPQGDPARPDTVEHLASIDFSHPALSVFEDPEARYFSTVNFYKRFPLSLPAKQNNAWTIAEFSKGVPALVESRYGDGLVVVAAFPASPAGKRVPQTPEDWTNLPLKPEWVPLVLRLVSHVQHRADVEGPSVVPADGVAEVRVAGAWAPVSGTVTDAAGRSTPLTFERAGSRLVSAFEKTADRGYYAVDIRGGRADQRQDASFAVNLAPEESDFATLGEGQLRELLPGTKLTLVDASAQALQDLGSIGGESEIWQWLIYIVFVVIGVEFMLATFGGAKKATEENLTVTERIRQLSPGSWVGRMTGAPAKGVEE
jgi:hypothetical protein